MVAYLMHPHAIVIYYMIIQDHSKYTDHMDYVSYIQATNPDQNFDWVRG